LKRQKKKGGKLPVDLVKLAKIAISPVLGKSLAADEVHSNQQKYKNSSVRGRVELRMLFPCSERDSYEIAKSIALLRQSFGTHPTKCLGASIRSAL
jgi:hypothetical protein